MVKKPSALEEIFSADMLNKSMLDKLNTPLEKFVAGYDIHDKI